MKKYIPNILTIFRIILVPIFIFIITSDMKNSYFIALIIFVFASITDALDGKLARKYGVVSKFGLFMDPLADKILVSSAFISFALMGIIEFWMVGLIIFRDLFVTGLRLIMSRNGLNMMTSKIAKSKTSAQIGIIIFTLLYLSLKGIDLLFSSEIHWFINEYELVYYLTLIVSIFTLYTGFSYIQDNRKAIKEIMN